MMTITKPRSKSTDSSLPRPEVLTTTPVVEAGTATLGQVGFIGSDPAQLLGNTFPFRETTRDPELRTPEMLQRYHAGEFRRMDFYGKRCGQEARVPRITPKGWQTNSPG